MPLRAVMVLLDYAPQVWTSQDDFHTALCRSLSRSTTLPIMVFSGPVHPDIRAAYEACGAHVEVCSYAEGIPRFYAKLRKLLRRYPVDLTHVCFFNYFSAVSWLAYAAGARKIVFFEQNSGYSKARSWRRLLLHGRTWLMTFPLKRVMAMSASVKDTLVQVGLDVSRIVVVHGGIDPRRFSPRAGARENLTRQIGIGSHEVIVSTVSFLRPFKRTDVIIRAFGMLLARGIPARLVVAGDGPLRRPWMELCRTLAVEERTHWLGDVANVEGLLQASDIFVLASVGEAFGYVLAEAQACEVPVVGSRSGSIPEVIEDGVTGILAEPGDPASFADGMERLARDPALRRGMGQQGRRRVLERFTADAAVARVLEVYQSVLES